MEIKHVREGQMDVHQKSGMDIHQAIKNQMIDSGVQAGKMVADRGKEMVEGAGKTARTAVTSQIEGGSEVEQALAVEKELAKPVTKPVGYAVERLEGKALDELRKKLKVVSQENHQVKTVSTKLTKKTTKKAARKTSEEAMKQVAKEATKKVAKESAKGASKEAAKAVAKTTATVGSEVVGTAAACETGPFAPLIGLGIGEVVGQGLDLADTGITTQKRKLKFMKDKMQAQDEQKDDGLKLARDNVLKWGALAGKQVAKVLLLTFLPFIPIIAIYGTLMLMIISYIAVGSGTGGNPQSSLTEEEIAGILDDIEDETVATAVEFALRRVGYPYSQEERDSGEAYDCSSLVYYACKEAGVDISYGGAYSAAAEGQALEIKDRLIDFSELQAGDLIFYSYKTNGRFRNISHVSMYVGNGKIVEAQDYSTGVVMRDNPGLAYVVIIGRPAYDEVEIEEGE